MKKITLACLGLLLLIPLLVACGDAATTAATASNGSGAAGTTASAKPKQAVTIALSYIPNVQFAPFYVAQDKGYYATEGLDVTFQNGTINDLMALVGQGKIPFALASGDEVLQARAGGIPVVNVATQYQKYPIAIISQKGKGILKAADLKGKTIGIPGLYGSNYIGLKAILASAKLGEEDVKIQAIGYTQKEALIQGKVDAVAVYSMNEPVQLQSAGVALDVIEVSSLTNLASVGLITSENLITTQPDLVQKVVRASMRGAKDTVTDPDAAFESSIKVAPEAKSDNPNLQRQVLKETVKFMTADNVKGQPYGYSDPKVWETSQQFMLDNKLLPTKVDFNAAFTNKFLSAEVGKY